MSLIDLLKKTSQNWKEIVLVFVVFLAGFVVRMKRVWADSFMFLFDQGRDLIDVSKIVVDRHPTLIGPFSGIQGVFHGPLHYYLLVIPFVLFNGNPRGVMVFFIFVHCLGILSGYLLGKRMIGGRFGILLSVIFAFSPASIGLTAIFWNPNWIPVLMVLFISFLYLAVFKEKKYLLAVSLFVLGLIFQFEFAFGVFLIPIIIILLAIFNRPLLFCRNMVFGLGLFLVTFMPQIIFDIRNNFLMSRSVFDFVFGSVSDERKSIVFSDRILIRANEVLIATTDSLVSRGWVSILLLAVLMLFVTLLWKKKSVKSFKSFAFFSIFIVTFNLMSLFYPYDFWGYYLIGVPVMFYFLVAFCLDFLSGYSKFLKYIVYLGVLIWAVSSFVQSLNYVPGEGEQIGMFVNRMEVVDDIYADANNQKFGVFVYTPTIYDYTYTYLFSWKSRSERLLPPTESKEGVFYLIIEPNKDKPYLINGWKETVIKTGDVVWSREYPGGVVVEKRIGYR